jgi:D-alanyl-D-alanine carboxypeptidase
MAAKGELREAAMACCRRDSKVHHRWRGCKSALTALVALFAAGTVQAEACGDGSVPIAESCVAVEEAADRIRELVRDAIEEEHLKAVIVSVEVGDVAVLREARGESMTGVPATPEMHFRNGAVAIAYLATVLLRLQDGGVIDLDDRLATWFPDYPQADRVTLRMLINSTSGYADYVNLDILPLYEDVFRQWTPEELIALGLDQPMACEPGSCFNYAHTNFVILGEVLSKATGKPMEELLRENIIGPLALDDTRSEATAIIQQPVLHAFTAERGIYEDSTYWNPSWTLARGAIMTTSIDDLVTSAVAIGSGSLISPQAHEQLLDPLTAQWPPFSDDLYYGLGVLVNNGWVVQTPSFAGYAAAMAYLPERRIAIGVTATLGPDAPPDADRPTDSLYAAIAGYLAPEQAPRLPRRR